MPSIQLLAGLAFGRALWVAARQSGGASTGNTELLPSQSETHNRHEAKLCPLKISMPAVWLAVA